MEKLEDRPPYVMFELRPVEDRQASIETGAYKTKDVEYAIITPAGSKDRIERIASEWFENLEQQVQADRFPKPWLRELKLAFAEWKEGREPPLNGTALANWPLLSPAQRLNFARINIKTIEDVAVMNEESIKSMGMGGRELKAQAQTWLKLEDGETAKVTAHVNELEAKLKQQAVVMAQMEEKLSLALQGRLPTSRVESTATADAE